MINVRDDKEFLKELLEAVSPSGQEEKATEIWKRFMGGLGLEECYTDKMGNSAFSIGKGEKKILLSGHIDQVNARVSLIHDSGLLALHYTGGIDNRCLPGSRVIILTDEGKEIEGAVIKQAMHLDDNNKWPENHSDFSQFRVDIGCESKEEVESLGVHPGCLVVYKPEVSVEWGKNKICSCSLDDKIAVFIVAGIMKSLKESLENGKPGKPCWYEDYTIIGLAATQEETGLRGATVAARNINADYSFDIDVEFGSNDELSGPKEKIGDIKLGSGPIIAYGADKSVRLNMALKECAPEKYQTTSTTCGGTNTDAIQLSSADCETAHVAIPNFAMHSPVEVCDWRDVQGAVEMIYNVVVNCKV